MGAPEVTNAGVSPPAGRGRGRHRALHRSLVVLGGRGSAGEADVEPLLEILRQFGIRTKFLGREEDPRRIAEAASAEEVDTVELCLVGPGGIPMVRDLLRELIALDRRDVTIVVHRVELLRSVAPLFQTGRRLVSDVPPPFRGSRRPEPSRG